MRDELVDLAWKVGRRLRNGLRSDGRFRGAFNSYEEALAGVRPGILKGYNHDAVSRTSCETMSQMALQDYPVLYWLKEIIPQGGCVLDAGGHMGTKYRAFRTYFGTAADLDWWVYDLPAIVSAGKEQALKDGLTALKFVDNIQLAPAPDVFVGSGLLQYLDVPLNSVISRLTAKPRHLLLNKVATREGTTVVMLENFGMAEIPYQIRNRADFTASLGQMGYRIVDEWIIPHLAHSIPGHPQLGISSSRGYYAVLD